MAKVLQLNLNHCSDAQDLLSQLIREENIDVSLVSEQYRDLDGPNWVKDATGKAAVWICGKLHLVCRLTTPAPGFTWVEVAGVRIYSCYFPPSATIEEFLVALDALIADARSSRLPIAIGGDFNAWATEWGSTRTNHRGRVLLESFAILGLEVANTGGDPTCARVDRSSVVDLTFVDVRLMGGRLNWHISERYTGSDHHAIVCRLQLTNRAPTRIASDGRRRWAAATFNRETFLSHFEGTCVAGSGEDRARGLSSIISSACDVSMSRRSNTRGRPPVYW